jgi:REP element-mobilizing transposase RayT
MIMAKIVEKCWFDLPNHYHNIQLHAFMVMPNHVHGILSIVETDIVGAIHELPQHEPPQHEPPLHEPPLHEPPQHEPPQHELPLHEPPQHESPLHELPLHELPQQYTNQYDSSHITQRRQMLLPKILGRFKMNSAKQINELRNTPNITVWQRNYYEHIIRNDESFYKISEYIINNPLNWAKDNYYA